MKNIDSNLKDTVLGSVRARAELDKERKALLNRYEAEDKRVARMARALKRASAARKRADRLLLAEIQAIRQRASLGLPALEPSDALKSITPSHRATLEQRLDERTMRSYSPEQRKRRERERALRFSPELHTWLARTRQGLPPTNESPEFAKLPTSDRRRLLRILLCSQKRRAQSSPTE